MNEYPVWFINAMNELEDDLDAGIITFKQFNDGVAELERELEGYPEDDYGYSTSSLFL